MGAPAEPTEVIDRRRPAGRGDSRSAPAATAVPDPAAAARPPGRVLLHIVGLLSQLMCGGCLLVGTIGLVLVQQSQTGGLVAVAVWLVAAMAGLVFGGLVYRGGMISLVATAVIDAWFGVALIAIGDATLRTLLRVLPPSDIAAIGVAIDVAGCVMIGAGALCVTALPQGLRYARWFREAAALRSAMSTARGFPPPLPARGSAYIIPAEQQPGSRRRLYLGLGGLAIAVGTGAGVLVSAVPPPARPVRNPDSAIAGPAGAAGPPVAVVAQPVAVANPARPSVDAGAGEVAAMRVVSGAAPAEAAAPADTVQQLLAARRAAIAHGDGEALADLLVPGVFGFGIAAGDTAEGKAAVVAQLVAELAALGEPPASGFTVESRALAIGGERDHAWIAEELAVAAPGQPARRLAISELAAVVDGRWQIVALHWSAPVDDATAERLAILNTLPAPRPIADRHDGPEALDQAVRAAFADRAGFVAARSPRPDGFNLGSGGERVLGGAAIKRLFGKLKAQIRMHDGARVAAGSAWDPAQRTAPWIAWAAVNVDFTARTRAATELTQTFRVLAILVADGAAWKLVQTHWSNGVPIR